jgi:hypothetical protein
VRLSSVVVSDPRVVAMRSANRTGTMRERPLGSGRWQLRVFAGIDPTTGRCRAHVATSG